MNKYRIINNSRNVHELDPNSYAAHIQFLIQELIRTDSSSVTELVHENF